MSDEKETPEGVNDKEALVEKTEESVNKSDISEEVPEQEIEADNIAEVEQEPQEETSSLPPEIFVVLCERDDINQDCLNVLSTQNIRPIIVNDPNETQTLIEIVNQKSNVQFALVILAGDDFIYDRLAGKPGNAELSAKPNNVFHLGFFLAKFGNMGIMTIYREQKSFKFPTGNHQTAFVPYQKGGAWEEILMSKLREQKNPPTC